MPIKVQKLFVFAVILKVGFSGLGWYLSDPWVLGLALPLTVMALYIGLGARRSDKDVSDEKFADSCYYIGFIFTITSIIFSLFDLPQIGAKMSEIAVRFGVAMVSTVVGLAVRVYLVSFKQDLNDAVAAAEEGVIDATNRLREQLTIALEKMREFDSRVDEATKTTIANVSVGVEKLTESYGEKLTDFFEDLAQENKEAFASALNEVKTASNRLSDSVDGYSAAMRTNLQSIEAKVTDFAAAVTKRLQETTFPDDYFAKRLEGPLAKLGGSTEEMARHITGVSSDVASSVTGIRTALAELRSRAGEIDDALSRVTELCNTQERIVTGAQTQVDTLGIVSDTLRAAQRDIGRVSEAVVTQTQVLERHVDESRSQTVGLSASAKELATIGQAIAQTNRGVSEQQAGIQQVLAGLSVQTTSAESINAAIQGMLERLAAVATEFPQVRHALTAAQAEWVSVGKNIAAFERATGELTQRLSHVEVKVHIGNAAKLGVVDDFGSYVTPEVPDFKSTAERLPA
ncbi:methyl-accepting chemotaxis protein [Azoarcus sp. KH32C]|uniref:methyl-accepting chemotaxis protein n=1 Tax=Azoarcus sp. KH32C TaxID=748247 RepID=UPI0002386801|nr:methyl-accepting chemotaxis protein [Azoarcus sp. KH32C]BAL23708.1 hypothetical protein AZKH_1386 [Azoarcus sp. KH32C]